MPNRITLSRTIASRILSTVVLCGFVHSGAFASDVLRGGFHTNPQRERGRFHAGHPEALAHAAGGCLSFETAAAHSAAPTSHVERIEWRRTHP